MLILKAQGFDIVDMRPAVLWQQQIAQGMQVLQPTLVDWHLALPHNRYVYGFPTVSCRSCAAKLLTHFLLAVLKNCLPKAVPHCVQ